MHLGFFLLRLVDFYITISCLFFSFYKLITQLLCKHSSFITNQLYL